MPTQTLKNLAQDLADGIYNVSDRMPRSLVQLGLRWGLAGVFWTSARTKVEGVMTISDNTYFLFSDEYKVPLLPSDLAATLATYSEHAFAILLFLGLASRLSALGVFAMTLVIQLFVYPDALVGVHLGWFAMALAIATYGPGKISLDHIVHGKVAR
ncbi:DoxX family protein (plasmid) [Caulobacter sp. ErkDOM-YI]|uniref:DoxX family protein n=1 Tax=unclassified Caulobacter TaxID=2648921 RepID=UPI003AF4F812